MTPDPARNRWLALVFIRLVTALGAVLGVILLAQGEETGRKLLGGAILLASLWAMAVLPPALARRWRSPVE